MATCTYNPGIDSYNPYAVLTVTETSYNVNTNSSVVSWNLKLYRPNSISSSASKSYSVVINGATVASGSTSIGGSGTKTIASGTRTITHNSDGKKTISFSFALDFEITWSGTYIGTGRASGSLALTNIPRVSTFAVSKTSADMGTSVTFTITRASTAFTHTLTLTWGGVTSTIATGVTTSRAWTIPLSLANDLPNSTSSGCIITCITYNGSTEIGRKTLAMTLKVPSSVKPSVSNIAVSEATSGLASKFGAYIQGHSKLKVVTTAAGSYSSTIKSYAVKILGKTYSGSTITSDAITSSGSVAVAVTVTDSRGRTATSSTSVSVSAYHAPTISALTAQRCESDGTLSYEGEYVKLTYAFDITTLSDKNDKAYTLAYKLKSASEYTTLTSGAVYSLNTTYIPSTVFSGDESYDFRLTVSDYFTAISFDSDVPTAFTLMDYHASGTGLAIGKVANKENTLEIALDTEFNNSLIQKGNRFAFSSYGTSGVAGYILMAKIKIVETNADTPITVVLCRRQSNQTMTLYIRFASSSVDPGISSFTYEGANYGAYLVKSTTSVWDLYVQKGSAWDTVGLQEWHTSQTMGNRIEVSYDGTLVDTVPTPYYRATPAIPQSIVDCFFSVGSIIVRYDHADPNTMFPGTTWVRIENSFLWGVDSSGTIGLTGGSKTHTLTVNELPSHTHNIAVANTATGSNAASNKIRYNNDGSSYVGTIASNSAGGGAAHNNMPPYTQVSIWRRTA